MKAIDRPFTSIINGASQFVIPVFQRDYTWQAEPQCAQLWRDVLRAARTGGKHGHFLGAIVYIPTRDSSAGFPRWLLIDGQQRLTTLTLLLAALRDHIRDSGWRGAEEDPTPRRIDAYFLKNVQETGDRQQKLVLRRHDQVTLRRVTRLQGMAPGLLGTHSGELHLFSRTATDRQSSGGLQGDRLLGDRRCCT